MGAGENPAPYIKMALTEQEVKDAFEEHVKECGCNVCKEAEKQNHPLSKCPYCNWSAAQDNLDSDAPRPYLVLHDFFISSS